ncbi:MAG TPA: NUDIX hydrolase [Myxococcota bacterium]|nr:NUDIX hydrolase [Myxococcota bacterium]HOA13759.1 NUDIX hydrolase [Myxococcota bacterium]HOC98987.1 NUDIX hydrolase [Myxococcota bacterium]HOH76795.1 NUDIX hydrolase [Myxococcota bacterium]
MKPVNSERMDPWELKDTRSLAKFGVYEVLRETRMNPRDGREHSFCVQVSRDWATVVPVTASGQVVLVRQFRPASGEVTWEFPGGVVETGEDPAAAVVRELEEESGFRAGMLVRLGSFRPNPALIRNSLHVFLASGCMESGSRNFDDSEDLDTFVADVNEVDQMVQDGRIDHALMVAAWLTARRRFPGESFNPPGGA